MNDLIARLICDGKREADEAAVIQAWQQLIDSGTVWQLQGFYLPMAKQLIAQGLCQPANYLRPAR